MIKLISTLAAMSVLTMHGVAIAKEMSGQKVAEIFQQCSVEANQKCGSATLYCNSYRRSYMKMCLVRNDVPPQYLEALLN